MLECTEHDTLRKTGLLPTLKKRQTQSPSPQTQTLPSQQQWQQPPTLQKQALRSQRQQRPPNLPASGRVVGTPSINEEELLGY